MVSTRAGADSPDARSPDARGPDAQGPDAQGRDAASVVVVGAGFAGVSTLKTLAKGGLRVTLVDHNIYSTFQPLLYQVATAGLNPGDVAYPARGFTHHYGVRFRRGELASVDPSARQVT